MSAPGARRAAHPAPGSLREVAGLFLKLGFIAFGGPAAHIAMMRDEAVTRRRWVTDGQFLDLLGASNLIPGPSSTEMAMYLGYRRAGGWGLALGGACFILPAMAIVLALAWAYVRYGSTPQATGLLYGVKPVIIAIIAYALWGLGRAAVKSAALAVVGATVVALYLVGANTIAVLFGAGLAWTVAVGVRGRPANAAAVVLPAAAVGPAAGIAAGVGGSTLLTLGLTFLKIGAVVYGSGYVLLAFLRQDFVERLHWLTDRQLIDAVIVGQFTPGPVFTTATFIGYLVGRAPGAVLATTAIFLPSFVFVAIVYPLIPRLRRSAVMSAFLDGVNVAALGLMAGVTWQLARAAVVDPVTLGITALALGALLRFRINSAWLVAAGAAVGLLHVLVG